MCLVFRLSVIKIREREAGIAQLDVRLPSKSKVEGVNPCPSKYFSLQKIASTLSDSNQRLLAMVVDHPYVSNQTNIVDII
jgi:hypothetical protein